MRYQVIHRRRWRRPANHLDGRVCPDCGTTAHGNSGQNRHQEWHAELWELLNRIFELVGVEPDDGPFEQFVAAEGEEEA